jgi:hypothetical protein
MTTPIIIGPRSASAAPSILNARTAHDQSGANHEQGRGD